MTPFGIRRWLMFFFSAVLALFIAAPFLCPYGAVTGLDGRPISPDYFDLWAALNPLSAAAYGAGDILCHQDAARSFFLNGSQLPICARDISALAGLCAGLILSESVCRKFSRTRACVLFAVLSFALMAADVAVQGSMGLNVFPARVATGAMCGLSVGFLIDRWIRSL